MPVRLLVAAALCLIPMPALSSAVQVSADAVAQEPTPAEAAARHFLDAMNGAGSLEPFIASSFTTPSLQREPAAERAQHLDRLKADTGGFTILSSKSEGERMVEMLAATRRGNRHAKIVLFTSAKEPGKIANVFILSARDPVKSAADAFPEQPVPAERIAAEIRQRIDSLAEEDRFSGAVLVAKGDKVLVREARGLAEQVWRAPNSPETRFNIASIGKIFTAAAVMRLVEQGKLSLDDTIAKRVPGYPHREAASKITLRHLLNQTAGLGEWDGRKSGGRSSAEMLATMTDPPAGEPGQRFGYSNAGFVLLAAAIEQATGKNYRQAVKDLVFDPAGMKSTGLWPVTAIVPYRATGYLRPPSDPLGFGPRFSNEQFLGFAGDGSGGAYSTVDDLFAFYRALANGRLVKQQTLREMVENSVEFVGSPRPWRYGYGLRLADCAGKPTLGHGGGGDNSGVANDSYASLDGEWTVIVLSNYDPPAADDLALGICEFVHRQ